METRVCQTGRGLCQEKDVKKPLDDEALDALFRKARSYNGWRDETVSQDRLKAVWDLVKMGPTSANCSPARIVYVVSPKAKERLRPCLLKENVEKTLSAPVTAIVGYDLAFYDRLPDLFPHADARAWFLGNGPLIEATAFRNGSMQGAYFMLAARALGLDCGPISGFDNDRVDGEFFPDSKVKSNFLCNIGYGDPASLYARSPRMDFDEACKIE
ncbi:MAG TPA: malonic semialdehyde reductase [Rhodospirillales bacterium]|nr:malonic semialdehyde reductase [Rhodospirillales bacterium]